ncbi:MAG TPA: sigma 54-interacting transcriptional regulator, partial [Polyangiaceae bacterium]|nr:sigma 54-interacting transcriptional regulator [Polyangiaceae bacterium]
MIGTIVQHRYLVRRELGRGGLATAYLVDDQLLGVPVALKLLHEGGAAHFRNEFALLRGFVHPHLAQLHDFGHDGGRPFYTARFVDGPTLVEHAAGKPFVQVLPAVAGALEGLRALHAAGIRHGDVKAENIIVDREDGRGVLLDLSCSQRLDDAELVVAGTPGHMAPELLAGERVDLRADLYCVGAMLLELEGLPAKVRALATRLQSEKPSARPSDVAEVLEALGVPSSVRPLPCLEPRALYGRDAELVQLEAKRGGALIIQGERGVGATRLLLEMKWRMQERCATIVGHAAEPLAVTSMLRRATGRADLDNSLEGVLEARNALEHQVLVLDDADQLSAPQRRLWLALLRSLRVEDRLLVLAVDRAFDESIDVVERCVLQPLARAHVRAWIDGRLPDKLTDQVVKLTGSLPAALQSLLSRLPPGTTSARELERAAAKESDDAATRALPHEQRHALGLLAALDEPLGAQELALDTLAIANLVRDGWVRAEQGRIALRRRWQAAPEAHARAADYLRRRFEALPPSQERSEVGAAIMAQLLRADQAASAKTFQAAHAALIDIHPDPWVAPVMDLAAIDPELGATAAEIAERAGDPRGALALLARMLRRRPADRIPIWLRAGAAYLKAGDPKRAVRMLARVVNAETDHETAARACDLMSRAEARRSAYEAAADWARRGLARAQSMAVRADLHDALGVAESYLGELSDARRHLDTAARLHRDAGQLRAQARSASYRALCDYRAGDTLSASEGFRQAMELAQRAGASDLVNYAAQNLASVSHQLGDLGAALTTYEHALEMARLSRDPHLEIMLSGNMAKLYADIGLTDRARRAAERSLLLAERDSMGLMAGVAHSTLGEIALAEGKKSEARSAFTRARDAFEAEGAARERAETELHLAECTEGPPPDLEEEEDADDLAARASLLRGRWLASRAEALEAFEEGLRRATRCGQRGIEAELHAGLARAAEARGAPVLARRHRQRAQEIWERMAASLPDSMRDAFWSHPARRDTQPTAKPESTMLERLLDINKRINSSLATDAILECTIDSALELTGAERGFLIMRSGVRLELAIARNLDPSTAQADEIAFSRSIAERVIETGEALITVDAARDERFQDQRSIHDMRLKSVLSVPIRTRDGVLGALYLDHRYKRAIFTEEARSVLAAFADQVAIALTNARLVEQLSRRTKDLERERKRIEKLMHGQARQIDRLTEEVRAAQRTGHGPIVGTSPAMQRAFATLERLTHANVPVLITGESGTGKELFARALHMDGPRKDGPMVAINCGALPEMLLESELFGHVRGAFTGADRDREGLFVTARGGTLFLDELAEMSPAMQVKLLRVLQEHEVHPVGARRAVAIDVRLVCATHKNLREEIARGRFREDLYYRVSVVEISVPPLRERPEDIPELVRHFLERASTMASRPAPRLTPEALRALMQNPWRGNVRELENVVTRAVLLADNVIDTHDLALHDTAPQDRSHFERDEA